MSLCLELGIVLIEVSVDFINVAIFLDCILNEHAQVKLECYYSGVSIDCGKPHDRFGYKRHHHIGFPIDDGFIVLFIGMQSCFDLFGEATVETAPHLFIVLCCLIF